MSKILNKKEYNEFLEKAYKQADLLYVDLDSVIENVEELSTGKFARLYDAMKDTKEEKDNNRPYTRLILNKNYEIYYYLQNIDNREDFSAMDEESEMSIWNIEFVKNDVIFAAITSHYRDYEDGFYFLSNISAAEKENRIYG